MRIGITCYPTIGGSGFIATRLGVEMAKRGHEVHFITSSVPILLSAMSERGDVGVAVDNIFCHEVIVPEYPLFKYPPYDTALASRMAEVIEEHDLDILHVHYAVPHTVCAFLARQMVSSRRTKFVTTLHGTDITLMEENPSYRRVLRFALGQSDGVTTVSDSLRLAMLEDLPRHQTVEVIHNFVDTQLFAPRSRLARRGDRRSEKVVVHSSNLRPVKQVGRVIEVFANICAHVPARLIIIGDGPERAAAEQAAETQGLSHQVSFLGTSFEVADVLRLADLFLLPSKFESFGLAALEAMACGVPVVMTRNGGGTELVEDGVSGALVDPDDVALMTRRALEILEDSDFAQTMSLAARQRALARFSIESRVDQYERYYRELLS